MVDEAKKLISTRLANILPSKVVEAA